MSEKTTIIANEHEIEQEPVDYRADILALTNMMKDLSDSLKCMYNFMDRMYNYHWPFDEIIGQGERSLDEVQSRLDKAMIFDYSTREWLCRLKKEGNGKGDRK